LRIAFAITTATLLLASCRDALSPLDAHESARAKWAERGPSSYSIIVSRSCECTSESSAPAIVTVQNQAVESRVYVSSGEPVPAMYAGSYPDVSGMFAEIEEALAQHPAQVTITYDDALGYPASVSIDFNFAVADDEFIYQMSELTPR
jgi:hypothetical protein